MTLSGEKLGESLKGLLQHQSITLLLLSCLVAQGASKAVLIRASPDASKRGIKSPALNRNLSPEQLTTGQVQAMTIEMDQPSFHSLQELEAAVTAPQTAWDLPTAVDLQELEAAVAVEKLMLDQEVERRMKAEREDSEVFRHNYSNLRQPSCEADSRQDDSEVLKLRVHLRETNLRVSSVKNMKEFDLQDQEERAHKSRHSPGGDLRCGHFPVPVESPPGSETVRVPVPISRTDSEVLNLGVHLQETNLRMLFPDKDLTELDLQDQEEQAWNLREPLPRVDEVFAVAQHYLQVQQKGGNEEPPDSRGQEPVLHGKYLEFNSDSEMNSEMFEYSESETTRVTVTTVASKSQSPMQHNGAWYAALPGKAVHAGRGKLSAAVKTGARIACVTSLAAKQACRDIARTYRDIQYRNVSMHRTFDSLKSSVFDTCPTVSACLQHSKLMLQQLTLKTRYMQASRHARDRLRQLPTALLEKVCPR